MFVRKVRITENRKRHVYLEIVDDGQKRGEKGRVVARLGPVGRLAGELDTVVRGLREFCREKFVSAEEISAESARCWGPVQAAARLWEEIGLAEILSTACRPAVVETAFALIAERLVDPRYAYGMNAWLENNFVPDRSGCGLDAGTLEGKTGRSPKQKYSVWDNTLRKLAAERREIEDGLLETVKERCGSCDEVVLYELESKFIEGLTRQRPMGMSAEGLRRNIRLYLGALDCGGWPLTIRFFGGNEPSVAQIRRFIEESQRRIGFKKVIVVPSDGAEEERLHQLESLGFLYLVGVRRRRDPRAVEVIQEAGRKWTSVDDDTKVQEVLFPAETDSSLYGRKDENVGVERYFLVHSKEDEKEERYFRTSVVSRALRALEELRKGVEAGRFKKPAIIMARAERILAQRKSYRHISCRITPAGHFEFWEDEQKSAIQRAYEGISLLKTNDLELSPLSATSIHSGLRRLESSFETIYDTEARRPVPLPLPELEERATKGGVGNVFAGHLLAGQLAYILRYELERCLQAEKIVISPEDAIEALRSISLLELELNGERYPVVSPGNNATAQKIVGALRIGPLETPASICGREE